MRDDRLEPEFVWYSEWLVEAMLELGIADRIPAACRGSGDPVLLRRLAGALALGPGVRMLDLGCGLGGPGAWLQSKYGCSVVGVDVVEAEVRGRARLFPGSLCVVAGCVALPFRSGGFDAAWGLGVVELVRDKAAACRELARVVRSGGSIALWDYVTTGAPLVDVPLAGCFEPPEVYRRALASAGLEIVRAGASVPAGPAPAEWVDAVAAVTARVEQSHGTDPRYSIVAAELGKIRRLCSGALRPWEFIARKGTRTPYSRERKTSPVSGLGQK